MTGGNGKIKIGGRDQRLHALYEKIIKELVTTYDATVIADAGLSLFLTVYIGSLGPGGLKKRPPDQVLSEQIAGFKGLLESVRKQRGERRIIST